MKRFSVLLLLSLGAVFIMQAQTQRLVLLEHFTQASCGPCATYNPAVQTLLNANPDKVTSIKYQTSWPGYDPMNLHNPSDVAARVSFYGGGFGVPYSVIDGNQFSGHPANWNINTINARYATPSPFDIQLQHWLSPNQDSIYIVGIVKATAAVSGNLTVMVAVLEKLIQFPTSPGSNGETSFHNVMKKLLPNQTGTPMPASMQTGDYVIIQEAWKLANVYNQSQLGVLAWVQDKITKEVHQAATSTTSPVTPAYSHDLAIRQLYGIGSTWCQEEITPRVAIRNQGSQVLNTAQIKYSINGGAESSFTWTGSLGFLEEAEVILPVSSLTIAPTNLIKAYIHSVNGLSDDHARNDTIKRTFTEAPETTSTVHFFMRTDNNPDETTWDVTDDQGNILYSGGPYTQSGKIIQQSFSFSQTGCYTFTLRDAAGNGICCSNGFGVYQLTSNIPNQILGEGDAFGVEAIHAFTVSDNIGIKDLQQVYNLEVFPNPASANLHITYELTQPQFVGIAITDLSGRRLMETTPERVLAGHQEIQINTSQLNPGMYLLQFMADDSHRTIKLQITH